MNKKLDVKILITTIVTLLPIVLGIINGFSSNLFLAFIVPVIFAIINIFENIYISKYEKANTTSVITYQCRWIIPVVSIVSMSIVISRAMKIESPIYYIIMSLIGIYVCSSGVKLIESKNEANCIFKLPSFLKNKNANCEKFDTIGYIWIASGLIFTALVYLRVSWFVIGLLLCAVMFVAPLFIFRFMYKHVK